LFQKRLRLSSGVDECKPLARGCLPDSRLTFDKTSFFKNPKTWFHTLQNYGADFSFWHDSSEMEKFVMAGYKSAGRAE